MEKTLSIINDQIKHCEDMLAQKVDGIDEREINWKYTYAMEAFKEIKAALIEEGK